MCSRVLQRIQVRDMGLSLAGLVFNFFVDRRHNSINPDCW